MKKLVFTIVAAFSFVVFGAKEKVATVQLADTEALVKGVSKLGEFTGNQMLGIMCSQAMTKLPWAEVFGPARPGTATAFVVFMEGDDPSGAILYAPIETKAEFKKAHPKAVEKDGIIKLPKAVAGTNADDDEEEEEDSTNFLLKDDLYLAYSKDGKWLAASDKADEVKLALAEVKMAEKKMDGDLVKILVPPKGIAAMQKAIEKHQAKADADDVEQIKQALVVFKQIAMMGIGIRVNDSGLDLRGVVKPVKGSDFAKIGMTAISAEAWQTVDPAAVLFGLAAANSGKQDVPLSTLKTVLAKQGIKTDFLTEKMLKKGYSTLTLDAPAAVTYFKSATNELSKVDCQTLFAEIASVVKPADGALFPLTNDPFGGSLVLKGFTPVANAKERFEATLPEAKTKPCSNVGFLSVYSIFKALTPVILENLDKDERMMLEPMLLTLPSEGKTGIAWAQWCEKGATRFIFRIGADEFKSVSAGFAAFSAMQMQKLQQGMK